MPSPSFDNVTGINSSEHVFTGAAQQPVSSRTAAQRVVAVAAVERVAARPPREAVVSAEAIQYIASGRLTHVNTVIPIRPGDIVALKLMDPEGDPRAIAENDSFGLTIVANKNKLVY